MLQRYLCALADLFVKLINTNKHFRCRCRGRILNPFLVVALRNVYNEYKDKEADAFELFKLCHYSKKNKGCKFVVQLVIVR
jgi:hypothetical protein